MKLWIDDLRPAPKGFDWAKTSQEAIDMIQANPPYEHISFDHDLGGEDTTRRVVLWLCYNEEKWCKTASVHSMNSIGREWLTGMIQRYGNGCILLSA